MSRDALVVGINSYQYLPSLKAPAKDAEVIAQCLQQQGDFHKLIRLPESISKSNNKPKVSATQAVSQPQLEQALKQLFRPGSSQAPETALFYFSGHGLADPDGYDKGYLATSDTQPSSPKSGLSLRWLQWLLSESTIKQQIVWLDCCHSGVLVLNVGAANPGHTESRDRCFIASSRDFENSWEDLNSPYSSLTKALLDGLEPNRLPGRWIDSYALADFVNQSLKGELQTPVCTVFGEAINLTRTWQVPDALVVSNTTSSVCPYKGLEFFDCNMEDPKYFYGRETLTDTLVDKVNKSNFMALVGASGSGKSSVLRAGLLHQLKLGRKIAGSADWQILLIRPDDKPIQNLALAFVDESLPQLQRAAALAQAEGVLKDGAVGLLRLIQTATAPRVILVVDQFEEVFTRCLDVAKREQFFACLIGALLGAGKKLCVILTMRADFLGKCLAQPYSGLAQQIQNHLMAVLPMQETELKLAICKPAEQMGLTVEPELVTQILKDIKNAPGGLPLLQYTLKEVWKQRQGNKLVLNIYQSLGGIEAALEQRATNIYQSFNEAEQKTVRHIFLALTQLGEGTEDTRRRVFQQDLVTKQHPIEQINGVLERLTHQENRLLVTTEVQSKGDSSGRMEIVEVAHEALIRHWSLLQGWLNENRDLLRQQRKIEASAVEWREQGRKPGYVLQGLPLMEAKLFQRLQQQNFPLSVIAADFIQTSIQQQRITHLKTASWLLIPALILIAVVESYYRESGVKADIADIAALKSKGSYEGRKGIENLVQGCNAKVITPWLPNYLSERLFGNCRDLAFVDLSGVSLVKTNFFNTNLKNSNISNSDLSGANFTKANLTGINLSKSKLVNANLSYTDLSYSDLSYTLLSNANFSNANMSNINLDHSSITESLRNSAMGLSLRLLFSGSAFLLSPSAAFLLSPPIDSDLSHANFSDTDLKLTNSLRLDFINSNLSSSNLRNANFYDTNFSGTNLSNADFSNTDLTLANLSNSNLSHAIFHNTNLEFANISNADFSTAIFDKTKMGNTNMIAAIFIFNDLRETDITLKQLTGKNSPLICNVYLSEKIKIDSNRDCDKLPQVLYKRYPKKFKTIEAAIKHMKDLKSLSFYNATAFQ